MGIDIWTNRVGRIPGAMKIVAHDIEEVEVLGQLWEIKPTKVPVGCWDGDRNLGPLELLVKYFPDILQKDWEVLQLRLLLAASVCGARVLPVEINSVEAVVVHHGYKLMRKALCFGTISSKFAKDGLGIGVVVVERPPTHREPDLSTGAALLDVCHLLEDGLGLVLHWNDVVLRSVRSCFRLAMGASTYILGCNVCKGEVDSIKMLGRDLIRGHLSAILTRRLPTLIISDDMLPDVATFALGSSWGTAVGLAFVAAIVGLRAAVSKLRTAHIEWTCLTGLLGVLAALGKSITVGLAALATVGWSVATPVILTATSTVGAFPVLGASKIRSTFLDRVTVVRPTLVDGVVARRGLIVGTPRHVCPRPW